MNVFFRTRRLVAANLHDVFDWLQSPEQLARHGLRELAAVIDRATAALARSLVAQRLLERRRGQQREKLQHWKDRAEQSVRGGNDASARQALARTYDAGRSLARYDVQLSEITAINVELRRQLGALRERYQQAGEQLSLHAARRIVAAAASEFAAAGSSGAASARSLGGLQQLLDQVERSAMESEVELELARDLDVDNDRASAERERQQFIEAELERLK